MSPRRRHTLEQAIDLQLALRTVLYPSGDWAHTWRTCAKPSPSRWPSTIPRRLGTGLGLSVTLFSARMTRLSLPPARPGACHGRRDIVLQALATHLASPTGPTCLSSGDRPEIVRPSTGRGATALAAAAGRGLRANSAGCHAELGCSRGPRPRRRGAADCRAAAAPCEPHDALGHGALALRQDAMPLPARGRGQSTQTARLVQRWPLGPAYTLAWASPTPMLTAGTGCPKECAAAPVAGCLEEAHAFAEQAPGACP